MNKEPMNDKEAETPRNDTANTEQSTPQEEGVLEQDADDPCKHWDSIGPCGWGC